MSTINISLPDKLKKQADEAISDGYFASFSDFARTAFRQILRDHKLDRMVAEAKREAAAGRTTVLRSDEDIDTYMAQFKPKK